jgi:hypothetical protein
MPLYDVTGAVDRLVDPEDAENYDVLQVAATRLDARSLMKDIRIIDTALQQAIKSATAKNKLVFTKTGILVGHSSITPTKDTNHIWQSAEVAYSSSGCRRKDDEALANELQLKWVGGMVRWRISVLPQMWLVYRRDSGRDNQFTGKEIKVSEYWISENYIPKMPPKKRGNTIGDLSSKWNSK